MRRISILITALLFACSGGTSSIIRDAQTPDPPDAGSIRTDAGPSPARPYDGPPLRAKIELPARWNILPDGQGARQIPVPGAWDMHGVQTSHAVYSTPFSVPAEHANARIFVRFEAVNFDSRVSINGREIGRHTGVLTPFSVELTAAARPSQTDTLEVDVRSHDTLGPMPIYPVGALDAGHYRGIVWDVTMEAVPSTFVEDAFIQPSFRDRALRVDYQLAAAAPGAQEGKLRVLADSAEGAILLGELPVTLAPGTSIARFEAAWPEPHLWFPDDPHLYHLETQLEIGGTIVDVDRRRFGFREFWIEGDQFRLNGVRANLRGESSHRNSQWITADGLIDGEERYFGKGHIHGVVDRWKSLNFNVVRFHQAPPAPHVWEACDELGMMVINESAMYARDSTPNGSAEYSQHALEFIPPWIRSSRNHPSIVINVVENEMWLWGRRFPISVLSSWGAEVKRHDPTRPTMYEGSWDLRPSHNDFYGAPGEAEIFSYHYAAGGGVTPSGFRSDWPADDDYYAYAETLKRNATPNKPTSHGELLWGDMGRTMPEAHRMMAIAVRAMRYHRFADIRPYQMSHLWVDRAQMTGGINGFETDEFTRRLEINSFAPVAAFDVAYDRLGHSPAPPQLGGGAPVTRTIAVYNDEWRGTLVRLAWETIVAGTVIEADEAELSIELGSKIDHPIELDIPAMAGQTLELHLRAHKNGLERFHEVKTFVIR